MNRRHFLRHCGVLGPAIAGASALPWLAGCAPARDLPPVHVAADREIRTVVGLRPYRPSGFVVRAEPLEDTLVVHHYGHGGAGITLSWGTAKLAVDLGLGGHRGAVAVLGCGAVGLANARLLQEAGFAVTIYTKAMPPETTSR
jgi:D-amino-acid oxidase